MADRHIQHLSTQLAKVFKSGRWTPGRKLALLVLIKRGMLTEAGACARYGISAEELASWRRRDAAHGHRGLCATKLQELRSRNSFQKRPA